MKTRLCRFVFFFFIPTIIIFNIEIKMNFTKFQIYIIFIYHIINLDISFCSTRQTALLQTLGIWRWQVVLQYYIKYILHIKNIYMKTSLYIRITTQKCCWKSSFFFSVLWHTIYNFCHLSESVNVLMCMCICVCFEAIYAEYGGKDGNWRWVYNIDTIYLTMILILFIFYDFGK